MLVAATLLLAAGSAAVVNTTAALASAGNCSDYALSSNGMVDAASMLKAVDAADVTACCAICTDYTPCVAFTFNEAAKSCRMTAWPYQHSAKPGTVQSGVSNSRKPPPGPPPSPSPGPSPGPPRPSPTPPAHPTYCKQNKCKNVLYFLADDMRADWGAYGLPVVTPNLDALAKDSLLFQHAFCQMSVCSPSRQSFMTSRRPDTNQVWYALSLS